MNRRNFVASLFAPLVPAATAAPVASPLLRLWGDGVHDDTAAFQALIDKAQGSVVFIPAGTYRVTSVIRAPSGVRLLAA